MRRLLALVPLFFSLNAAAQVVIPFEAALGSVRQNVLAQRAVQLEAKGVVLAADIARLENSARRVREDVQDLRAQLWDIRRRTQAPQAPDSFLRYDLQRFTYFLRDAGRKAQDLAYNARRLVNAVTERDPALVAPAQALASETLRLNTDAQWIQADGQSIAWDLRRMQLHFEAFELENESRNLWTQSNQSSLEAQHLLSKVR